MASLRIASNKSVIQKNEQLKITTTLLDNKNQPIQGMKVYLYYETEASPLEPVYQNYQSINQSITQLRKYLISQLKKCFLTDLDDLSFTELINKVGEIEAVEHYNSNNIKPTKEPVIDNTNLTTYNETLFFKIRYYMKLLAYYLCLKGVPTSKIGDQHDLAGLISLIDLINVKLETTMTVQDVSEEYYFGLNIMLNYTLKDIYGNDVTDGEILIESNGIIYDSIEAGQPISFTPLQVSEKNNGVYEPITFTFTYMGADKYKKHPSITRDIIIYPAKINLNVFISNNNMKSTYYGSTTSGYSNDVWNIIVKTYNYKGEVLPNIPFTLSTDDDIINLLSLNGDTDVIQIGDILTLKAKLSNILNTSSENQTVLFSQEIDDNDLDISLSVSDYIVQQNEDITLTSTITDSNNNGVEGIVVDFYRDSYTLDSSLLNSSKTIIANTDENGTCIIDCVINQVGNQIINIETTYENTDLMTNTTFEHELTTYYNPLYQQQKEYYDYLGKQSYEYEIIIRDKYTGEYYSNYLDGEQVSVFLDDRLLKTLSVNDGKILLTLSSQTDLSKLSLGEHTLMWNLNGEQKKTLITFFSNFIFPNKDKFFLPDTPSIYYSPLYTQKYNTDSWAPIINKKAIAHIYTYDDNETLQELEDSPLTVYTNKDALLHTLKNYNEPQKYSIILTSDSDSLTENTNPYIYEIAKPFNIYLDENVFNKKEKAVFNIKIYDKEHYQIGHHTDYISFNKNFTGLYTFDENEYDEYYSIDITIPMREETIGENVLTVTINNYTESQDFKLIDKTFKLLTTTTKVGDNQIQIQCYDDDIEEIDIESDFISINDYTKTDGVFTINATFIKAGEIDFKINSDDDSENFTITVQKGVLNSNIIIEKHTPYTEEVLDEETQQTVVLDKVYIEEVTECYYSERENIHVRLELDNLYGDIDGIEYEVATQPTPSLFRPVYSEPYTISDEGYKHIPDLKPQEYEIVFSYHTDDNSNYASFFRHKTFTILKTPSILETDEQYTAFNDLNFFIYQPEFTEDNTEPLIRGSCSTAVSSQSNGIWDSVGYYLAEGWMNTGLWECDFDISGNIRYVGLDILCSISSLNEVTILMTGWEGPVATNPVGTYTRDNDNDLSFLPKRLAWQDNDTTTSKPYFTECHINMKKTSPTTLIITKTNGQYNNGSVTYEWQDLSNHPKLTIGTHVNPSGCEKRGTVQIKNFIVRGVY